MPYGNPKIIRTTSLMWGASIAILFVWTSAHVPLSAIPWAGYDDGLFIRGAENLLRFRWLGPYDNLTLAKGPGYPFFIALSWILGFPLLVAQALCYVFASATLAIAITKMTQSRISGHLIFLFLLCNPILFTTETLRVIREGLYTPITILILSVAIFWITNTTCSFRARAILASEIGAILAFYWCIREEGIWIFPMLLAAGTVTLFSAFRTPENRYFRVFREGALFGIVFLVFMICLEIVVFLNNRYYHTPTIVEYKEQNFLAAYGALSRIQHDRWTPYVVVSRDVLQRAYAVSPAAAELKPYIESDRPAGLVQVGCSTYGITPCDNEIRAGWFMWVFRDAAAAAGHFGDGVESRRYFGTLAREINEACETGRLNCLPPRATQTPPFRSEYLTETWTTSLRMLRMLVRMENLSLPDAPLSCIGRKSGDPCDTMSTFFDLTGTTLYTIPLGLRDTWITDYATWQQQQEATVPSVMLSNIVLKKIRALSRIISIILPILSYLAVLSFFAALGLQLKAQCRNISVVGAGICLIVVLTRVALLSFLDSVAMPSVNWLYLSPAVPAFLIFLVLAPTSFVVSLVRLRKISK